MLMNDEVEEGAWRMKWFWKILPELSLSKCNRFLNSVYCRLPNWRRFPSEDFAETPPDSMQSVDIRKA
tara:strand:+ start:2043 stop:2246 length:204 start_codon:yes stop_codon:yes gene_type:complete